MTDERVEQVRAAESHISEESLRELIASMVDIPSPTGGERPLAEWVVQRLQRAGMQSRCQPIDDLQANALGRIVGDGTGASLLLYAPLDSLTTGEAALDLPAAGTHLRHDMLPRAVHEGDLVVGLAAGNPKGHAACVIAAAEAIASADIALAGDLLVGLGAGGMPTNAVDGPAARRQGTGHGVGCSFMLEQGWYPDFAVIAKPGWSVAWEEVGLAWFRIRVNGAFGYVGSRHRLGQRNPIVDAATLIGELEAFFGEYAAANTSGLVAPQGSIGSIRAGWDRTASFCPAVCELLVDLRTSPRTAPGAVERQFHDAMRSILARNPQLSCEWELCLSIPGTHTDPASWIVRSAIEAWEGIEHRPHEPQFGTSGATDANILRGRGVPTARVGMPKVSGPDGREVDFAMGMNAVDVRAMAQLTRLLVRTAIDTCTRDRAAVGLDLPFDIRPDRESINP